MSDLIYRQAAIDALGENPVGETDWDLGCRNQWEWDTEILRTLPSAEPEQRAENAHWTLDVSDWENRWLCSECGYKWFFQKEEAHYCPNCGAKMEVE